MPHIVGPSLRLLDVQASGGVGAVTLHRAIGQTTRTGTLGGILGHELEHASYAGDATRLIVAHEPSHQVEVMTALGQQHAGATDFGRGILASHEGHALMEIIDLCGHPDVNDLADFATLHHLLKSLVVGSIAQHMADHYCATGFSGTLQ